GLWSCARLGRRDTGAHHSLERRPKGDIPQACRSNRPRRPVQDRYSEHQNRGCSFKINLALDTLPDFTAYPGSQLGPQHKTTIHICPSMDYMDRGWEDAAAGRPSTEPMLEITIPTTYDDSIAPPGKHIMCIFAQYAPYRLHDADWDGIKEQFADRCIDALAQYAPNIKDALIHRQVISPLDMEREYG